MREIELTAAVLGGANECAWTIRTGPVSAAGADCWLGALISVRARFAGLVVRVTDEEEEEEMMVVDAFGGGKEVAGRTEGADLWPPRVVRGTARRCVRSFSHLRYSSSSLQKGAESGSALWMWVDG